MSGILMSTRRRAGYSGGAALDETALSAVSIQEGTSTATATFRATGEVTLFGTVSISPLSPRWWGNTSPDATWLSYAVYSSNGVSTVIGGLVAGTRYQINTDRLIGIRVAGGFADKTFTISFYDAASGGTLLGTKSFFASAENATM